MRVFRRAMIAASLLAIAASAAPPANAQNLFDMLFGGGIKKQRGDLPPPPEPTPGILISAPDAPPASAAIGNAHISWGPGLFNFCSVVLNTAS
ncbi:MAG: hypothetical protein F9K43_26585 [Bauldia sp.]|nr:MAG: hypothetical protein F9K43_26585 [Bauldia sp.]